MAAKTEMKTYIEAQVDAIREEMKRDEKVFCLGESLRRGGLFSETKGLYKEFGPDRIIDTAINEIAIVDTALGAAYTGLRPIAFLMAVSFVCLAGDAILLKCGAQWKSFNSKDPVPLVINTMFLQGAGMGADHGTSTEALLMHSPHLKVVVPSNPANAKGLLKTAIRDEFPVVYVGHFALNFLPPQPVPIGEDICIPFGQADVNRIGTDLTIVTYSGMVNTALQASEIVSKEGISVEVIDLLTLVPLDVNTIVTSIQKTKRLLIAHQSMKRGGPAGEIVFRLHETAPNAMKQLKAIKRVGAKNVALPHGALLEQSITPREEELVSAIREICK